MHYYDRVTLPQTIRNAFAKDAVSRCTKNTLVAYRFETDACTLQAVALFIQQCNRHWHATQEVPKRYTAMP